MKINVTLPASDLERAKDWYSRVLQVEPVGTTEDGSYWFELDGIRFLVYGSQFAGTNQATAAGLEVDDVEAAVADFRSRGAVFEEYDFGDEFRTVDGVLTTPSGAKLAWMKDSEGNILGLAAS
jgi:catechol 2,3-dioxygenase-like lactoylglutathione lyase family enzyme